MPHYKAGESFKLKKSIEKKNRAKEKSLNKRIKFNDDFIVEESNDYGVVIETRYNDAYIVYKGEILHVKLRKDINIACNQVVFPGDKVIINNKNEITNLIKRKTILSRIKKDGTRNNDIGTTKNIATNVDLAVIVVAAKEPPLHPKFIDRYLMILQNNDIPAVICLNKCDLKTEEEEKILNVYRDLNIPVVETSTYNNIGIDHLKNYLDGKQAIFVGNSGVGKSSLTNAIMDDNEIKTSHISNKSKRGRHTTTTSKYYVWNDNSSIIDTPGIRSLDVSTFEPSEIQDYFPEFDKWNERCKYSGCLHYIIPINDCGVKQAVKLGIINRMRYESYIKLISSMLNDNRMNEVLDELDKSI